LNYNRALNDRQSQFALEKVKKCGHSHGVPIRIKNRELPLVFDPTTSAEGIPMDKGSDRFKKLLASVNRKLEKSSKTSDGLASFARHFFANGNEDDFVDYTPEEVAAIARSAFEFRKQRRLGKSKIRIFNPEEKKNGWSGSHTVIEVLNDDMPFLVDSVLDELAESAISIVMLLHPVEKIARLAKTGDIAGSNK